MSTRAKNLKLFRLLRPADRGICVAKLPGGDLACSPMPHRQDEPRLMGRDAPTRVRDHSTICTILRMRQLPLVPGFIST